MVNAVDVSIATVEVWRLDGKLVSVSDGSSLIHHLVCVDAGAIGVDVASGPVDALLR